MEAESTDGATVLVATEPGADAESARESLEGVGWDVRRLEPAGALEALDAPGAAVDCVVCTLAEPAAFLRACADRGPAVPVVYGPETADPTALSDAVAAGIDRYVPPAGAADGLQDAVEAAIEAARERESRRERTRASEELHRVTLNNMTDTVLITDEDGAFTYVCPNVHFIFGYTDAEIYDLGTIDELLGADLYDPGELAADGVLTNLECTATDKAGTDHTLLVNVREVSIQGGTVLYSCRDVTERKEREEALAALQRTARELLYAETRAEIARVIVEDASEVLGVEASAAFVFDTDENALRPVATTPAMEALHGPLPAFRASDDSLTGRTFVDGEVRFFDDVHEADALDNPATDVRSGAFLPLGEHGVFVAGSADVGRFDEVRRELADLLAATAEAALDRVERESTLRERDRELQRRNEELSDVNRTNELIREVDRAIVRAETRAEIERAVCDRLTATDRFRFAWIGEPDPNGGRLEVRAQAGEDLGYLEALSLALGGRGGDAGAPSDDENAGTGDADPDGTAADAASGAGDDASERPLEPACRALETGALAVVENVVEDLREEPWRREALSREFQSVVSVPLAYDGFTYGVLSVYADEPDSFDERSLAVFGELGETIASALGAIERKSALLSTAGTRLELEVDDPSFVFTRLAAAASCVITYDGGVRRTDEGTSVFLAVGDATVERVVAAASDLTGVEVDRVITDDGDEGGTLSVRLARPFVASRLADHGVVCRRIEATPEGATMVLDVPVGVDPRRSVEIVENDVSAVTLVSKGPVEDAGPRDLRSALLERLTDRQLEVVQVAYYGGFYESPRERTGEEIADALGISPAAFYKHNQRVQRALFTALFDDVGLPARHGG